MDGWVGEVGFEEDGPGPGPENGLTDDSLWTTG